MCFYNFFRFWVGALEAGCLSWNKSFAIIGHLMVWMVGILCSLGIDVKLVCLFVFFVGEQIIIDVKFEIWSALFSCRIASASRKTPNSQRFKTTGIFFLLLKMSTLGILVRFCF